MNATRSVNHAATRRVRHITPNPDYEAGDSGLVQCLIPTSARLNETLIQNKSPYPIRRVGAFLGTYTVNFPMGRVNRRHLRFCL